MSYQKVIIQGNLGQDPDIKYSGSGTAIARISVATSKRWTDKQTGQKQEKTAWHRIVAFGKLAEIMAQYLKKGSSVLIDGEIEYNKYTDQAGIEKYSTDIVANEMRMLDSRGDNQPQGQPMQQQQSGGAASDFHPDVPF